MHFDLVSGLNSLKTTVSVEKERYEIEEYDHSGVEGNVFHCNVGTAFTCKLIKNIFRHNKQCERLCCVQDCLYYHDEVFASCKIP